MYPRVKTIAPRHRIAPTSFYQITQRARRHRWPAKLVAKGAGRWGTRRKMKTPEQQAFQDESFLLWSENHPSRVSRNSGDSTKEQPQIEDNFGVSGSDLIWNCVNFAFSFIPYQHLDFKLKWPHGETALPRRCIMFTWGTTSRLARDHLLEGGSSLRCAPMIPASRTSCPCTIYFPRN